MDENDITVAIDGSLYKYHPRMKDWLMDIIAERTPDKLVNETKYFLLRILIECTLRCNTFFLVSFNIGRGW